MCHLQLLLFPFLKAIDEEVNKKEASFNPADNYSWEDPHAEVECDPNTQNVLGDMTEYNGVTARTCRDLAILWYILVLVFLRMLYKIK